MNIIDAILQELQVCGHFAQVLAEERNERIGTVFDKPSRLCLERRMLL